MKRAMIIATCFGVFIMCLSVSYLLADDASGQMTISNKIVVVKTFDDPDPVTLFGTPGTTVIWINHSRYPLKVVFIEKQVVLACGVPVNFVVNESGSYESGTIPSGGTASLCFTEKGRYAYKTVPSRKFPLGRRGKEYLGTVWIK